MLTQKEKAAMFSRMKSIYEDPSTFNNTKCLAVIAMCALSDTCYPVNSARPEKSVKKSMETTVSEAEKVFIKEILPLVTKSVSSITAELSRIPHHEDDEEIHRALYEGAGEKMKKRFCEYVDKTIDMHCEMLMNK